MTKDEALKLALEALENASDIMDSWAQKRQDDAIAAIKEVLAQRTWVGLTDEERKFIELGIEVFGMSVEDVLKEAEAKLKEKNT